MPTTLILFISAAGVIQAIVLAGLLYFHPKSDRSVTLFLSLHILTVSIFMLMPVAQYFFSWHSLVHLVSFQFLIGPFLYLYVCSFKKTISWRKAWPHFLLFIAFSIFNSLIYFPWIKNYPSSEQPPEEVLLAPLTYLVVIVRNLHMVFYYILAQRTLSRYQQSIQHLYSETSRINLTWVRWLLNGFLLLIVTVFILFYFVVKYPENFSLFILINTAVITPYIYLVAIRGMAQPTLWQILPATNKEKIEKDIGEAEIIESLKKNGEENQPVIKGLSETRIAEIIFRIKSAMEVEKIYQEPEFSLQNLADKLQLPAYQVSYIINEGLKKKFYDLVNGYRVEEAKRLLLDPRNINYTILSVGFEAGFNSKTTFNTVFKKFTGLTPTDFKEKEINTSADA